jgi:cell division protein FtsL
MRAKQFHTILLVLLVISACLIIVAFTWGERKLKENASSVSSSLAQRDAQRESIIALQQAEAQSSEIKSVNELLDRLLPKDKNQETLVLDVIYTATAKSQIPISSIATFSFSGGGDPNALSGTNPVKEIPGVREYPFNLELRDITFSALLTLLNEVEKNGRIIQIDTVQISPSKSSPGLLTSVNLSMKAYLQP